MAIIITLLFCICLILCFCLFRKHKVDKITELKNKELIQTKNKLIKEVQELTLDKEVIRKEILVDENSRNHLNQELNNIRNNISETISQNKKISDNAFQEYRKTLEIAYNDYERHFDIEMLSLHNQIKKATQELDKLKATRAAAHEALMKEQEIKDNKDNYRLIISEAEKRDIKLLNSVKKELINERPVNMIIWQTYYSKKANELCSRILGTKTITGIYKITEISTEKCYIGQSKNIKERFREHMKCGLGIDTPSGNKLYQAMLNSSIEDFTFELIEECNENDLDEKERYFIELYEAYDYGFNSNRGNKNSYKN